ncbi:MAG TPA: CAP domain-containing protein [Rhizomicrobium sp.]|jgi:uncharacterized protein YkwD|nr:CAP domain-containing protein [Rhizomicrobium sp.]
MHRRSFILGAALLLAACAGDPHAVSRRTPLPPPPDPATQMGALEVRINQMVDAERIKLNPGAKPLSLDSELVGIARQRSQDMATRNTFAPPGDDTHVSATLLMSKDATFQGLLGENVAAQHYVKESGVDVEAFAKRFVDTWLESEPHRKNLAFGDYNRTGVGAAVNGDTVYVTQLFATDLGLGPYKDTTTPQKVTSYDNAASAKDEAQPPPVQLRGSEDHGTPPTTP